MDEIKKRDRTNRRIWSRRSSELALKEGWDVFDADGHMQLQRSDSAERFADDAEAWVHVWTAAHYGSALHKRALAYIELTNPVEYRGIQEYVLKQLAT